MNKGADVQGLKKTDKNEGRNKDWTSEVEVLCDNC